MQNQIREVIRELNAKIGLLPSVTVEEQRTSDAINQVAICIETLWSKVRDLEDFNSGREQ